MLKRILNLTMLVSLIIPFLSSEQAHAAFTAKAASRFWDIQRIEDVHTLSSNMGDHAAIYDTSGMLHVAYGADHLYYARCTGADCTVEVVDDTDYVGAYASLALDSQGYPHIAYYDIGLSDSCNDEKVKYAAWDGSQWQIEIVAESCLGQHPSIALDGEETPHISFFNESTDNLMLADRQDGVWNAYAPSWLPNFELSGVPSSLQSDAQGHLHLAFIAGDVAGSGTVWYTRKTGENWDAPVEVDPLEGALRLSMGLDSSGNPHLAYNHHYFDVGENLYKNKLRYAHFDGSAWSAPVEVTDMEYLGWTSVLVSNASTPRLAYNVDDAISTISKSASGWGAPTAAPNTDGAERMYLGQGSGGAQGLTFYSSGALLNTTNTPPSTTWSAPTEIDVTAFTGIMIAMVASPTGDLHVAYTDLDQKRLRYAHRPVGGAWQIENLLETGNNLLIYAIDIDLDSNGRPQIVYQEFNQLDLRSSLKFHYRSASGWASMGVVNQEGHNGCAPSLELDAANTIYIAYNNCDYINDNLTLATYNGTWQYQVVDPDPQTSSASLVVNDQGHLYIGYVYTNYPNTKVRLARKEDTVNWVIEDAASANAVSASLVLDSAGKPHIAYQADTNPDYAVSVVYWNGDEWLVDAVSTYATRSERPSLVIDGQDRLHLVYTREAHPCYAVKDGGAWTTTEPVDRPPADPVENFGGTQYLAISLNDEDMPVIVYNGELDLKAAELREASVLFLPMIADNTVIH